MNNLLRKIPKVDECIIKLSNDDRLKDVPIRIIKNCTRDFLEQLRKNILLANIEEKDLLINTVLGKLTAYIIENEQPKFKKVINGTGVIVHTNLGRSLLPLNAVEAIHTVGHRYSNLEFDLATGKRGSRYSLVEKLLCDLTGAEAALVVNNNAAAVLICLQTMAAGKEVIVSRGQLVEIGGSFRIPEIMARSGATLIEVGATNRTHLHDYEDKITPETALLLKVHCSNYRIIGFTSEVSNKELVVLGKKHNVPVMEDLGSGCLIDLSKFGLEKEPTVQEVVESGMDIVTFSGDKLLGGPQAGIIVGKKEFIEKIKRNPLNRALRIDKFTLAGLESVLRLYLDPDRALQEIPTLNMISTPQTEVEKKAKLLADLIHKASRNCKVTVIETQAKVGGGAMPEQTISSSGVAIEPENMSVNNLENNLRRARTPIITRIDSNRLIIDLRTVKQDEINTIQQTISKILL